MNESFVSRSAKSLSPNNKNFAFFKTNLNESQGSEKGSEAGKIAQVDLEETKKKAKKICFNLGQGLQSLVLLEALGTHAFFEGIALGLTRDSSASFNIMVGLFIHKTAASLSLGISILKNFDRQDIGKGNLLMFLFALGTPLGILTGLLLQGKNNEMLEITMSSFAAGTFVYIAASEVIVEEFSIPGRPKWL